MKKLFAISLAASALLCGCDTDKSDDVQVTPAKDTPAYDAPKGGNTNVPANVKGAIPGG